jgi:hypothetical protein
MLHHKRLFPEGRGARLQGWMSWGLACACIAVMAPMAGIAQNPNAAGDAQSGEKVTLPATADKAPAASAQAEPCATKSQYAEHRAPKADCR